jgi:hypothetical protein
MVRRQVEIGIDCIGDGEFWTPTAWLITPHFHRHRGAARGSGRAPTTRHSTRSADQCRVEFFDRPAARLDADEQEDDNGKRVPRGKIIEGRHQRVERRLWRDQA